MTPRKKTPASGPGSRPGVPHYHADKDIWDQWLTIDGKRKHPRGKTKQDVIDQVAALRAGVNHPARRIAREEGPTLAELCETALKLYESPDRAATHHCYKAAYNHWKRVLGADTRQNTIKHDALQKSVETLYTGVDKHKGLAATTIDTYFAALRVALGAEHPALKDIQLPDKEDDGLKLIFTTDLIARLQTAAQHHRLGVLIGLGFGAGLRAGEACALRWRDINFTKRSLFINGSIKPSADGGWQRGQTKTRKNRPIKVSPGLIEWLQLHRRIQSDMAAMIGYSTPEYVAANVETGEFTPRTDPVKVLRELMAAVFTPEEWAEYGQARYHDLRHTHLSTLIAEGFGLADIAIRAGHSLRVLLQIYAHAIPGTDERIAHESGALFPITGPQATGEATHYPRKASQRHKNLSSGKEDAYCISPQDAAEPDILEIPTSLSTAEDRSNPIPEATSQATSEKTPEPVGGAL